MATKKDAATKVEATKKTTTRKAATIYVEMKGKQIDVKDIQAAVKKVKGATAAYLNAEEAVLYVVNAEGETEKVEL